MNIEQDLHIEKAERDIKLEAIRATYEKLSPGDREVVDAVKGRLMGLEMRGFGEGSALEVVGSIGIQLAKREGQRSAPQK